MSTDVYLKIKLGFVRLDPETIYVSEAAYYINEVTYKINLDLNHLNHNSILRLV